jgi:hypothetical protein
MAFITATASLRALTLTRNGTIQYQDTSLALPEFLLQAYTALRVEYPKFYKMDPLSKLGFLAAEVLLEDKPLAAYPPEAVSLVLSNAHASLDTDAQYQAASRTVPSPALFVYTLPNIVAGELCIRHGLKGENAFFVTPVFDASQVASYVDLVLAQPGAQGCVAGWVDVMGEHHDVFLYLAENSRRGLAQPHTAEQLNTLYTGLWNN